MNNIKIPSAFMQGFVAATLMLTFAYLVIGPTFPGFKAPSEATQQTVLTLAVAVVSYFLGTSQSSARKDELNAAQQSATITALSIAGSATSPPVTVAALPAALEATLPTALDATLPAALDAALADPVPVQGMSETAKVRSQFPPPSAS